MIVALIDYKAGNLTSVRKALAALGAEILTPDSPADLDRADAIIVPGVGHFEATAALDAGWHSAIRSRLAAGVPLLGICLGQQWLFEGSDEAPDVPGLGVFPGRCVKLDPARGLMDDRAPGARYPVPGSLKVPHVGWNALKQTTRSSRLLAGVQDEAQAYFTHSYVAPDSDATVAITEHGVPFASVVEHGLVFGAQFHPEKSGETGLKMLRNFLEVAEEGRARRAGPTGATQPLPTPDLSRRSPRAKAAARFPPGFDGRRPIDEGRSREVR
ncbi:Imidazole glycerol phosphate synthase subunit HisH 1 [Luteitalea pratensis]|uniref:Imidazole glycerol phosphate synthase subunit HisH n=1 Tax=Luteitalea pratensis TaxID=1855912 RepID=A0A143PXM9_LUTPR|nr:imidazole glycerol phosphate synthase subunit HisH [Luteitalea pratensis]AMY12810.1 Imidazole glycerol phosphate synthase subunit HisH 1 [Luteitalea pratensis]